MQIHQAVCQFALYTGVEPDFAVMETALLAAMDQAG
jgi:shikimate 5-dehydrogenase